MLKWLCMGFKSKLMRMWAKFNALPKKYRILLVGFTSFLLLHSVVFFIPKSVTFSYAGSTCVRQLTLFPSVHKAASGSSYEARFTETWHVGDIPIAATRICFTPLKPPQEGATSLRVSPFAGVLFAKLFRITVPAPPHANISILNKPVPASRPLAIPLSRTDTIFAYTLRANGKAVKCDAEEGKAVCDVQRLALQQGTSYDIEWARSFNDRKLATLATKRIVTLHATKVTDTSIKQGETVFSKPRSLDVIFDKQIVKGSAKLSALKGSERTSVKNEVVVSGNKLQVNMTENLPRQQEYELAVSSVEARDGSGLESPYVYRFKTSGGPKVTGVNVGRAGIQLGSTMVVTFDQPISEKQDVSKVIALAGGASIVAKKGAQLFISLKNVPKCGDFTMKIADTLESNFDIAGGTTWQYSGRMICHTVGTIGYSNKGRAINAYYFGDGPTAYLYTGAIHGNEISTKYLMEKWIANLEANARSIPPGRSIVVVPQVNPDGVAAGTRTNARNVDINRNFATRDWKKDITTVNNQPFPGGGGDGPMSEPETKALASFVQRLRPAAVFSYHSVGSVLAANQAGTSNALAALYSQLSGYRNTTGQTSSTFEYSISGTADDWYAEALGVPSVLIELGSSTNDQFTRNQKAMWAMIR